MPERVLMRPGQRFPLAVAVPVITAIASALLIAVVLLVGQRASQAQLSAVRAVQTQSLTVRATQFQQQVTVACAAWATKTPAERAAVPAALRAETDQICAAAAASAPTPAGGQR